MVDQIQFVSKYSFGGAQIHGGMMRSEPGSEWTVFMHRAPNKIVVLPAPPGGTGNVMGLNVNLVNPNLGRASSCLTLQILYRSQLKWLAETWARLCADAEENFGAASDAAPLLICSSGAPVYVITIKGKIKKVK